MTVLVSNMMIGHFPINLVGMKWVTFTVSKIIIERINYQMICKGRAATTAYRQETADFFLSNRTEAIRDAEKTRAKLQRSL